jgi:hypothetical protein
MSASDRRALVVLGVVLASWSFSACSRAPDIPETPDVSHLLAAYSTPSGTVDESSPAPWLVAGASQVDLLGGGQARMILTRVADNALKAFAEAPVPSGHGELVRTRVDGVATLEVACGRAAHETADVAVAIVDGAISPLMWGTAHACPLWQGSTLRASYDGSFTMYRYPGQDLLVRVDGTLTGVGTDINVDFRLAGGQLETRITTPTGDVIVTREGSSVVARAANGTFRCNTNLGACARQW